MTAPLLTTRDLGDLSPSTARRLAATGRLDPIAPDLGAVLDLVEGGPGLTGTVNDMAAAAGCDRRILDELFATAVGMTPEDYLTDARIRAARELLATTRMSVGAIGNRVGYGEGHNMGRRFRALTGMTPTEYREQVRS